MSEKDFFIWLDDRSYLNVNFTTVRGRVVSFVVRLMLVTDKGDMNVARYDTAHGIPHRDVLDSRGCLVRKDWLLNVAFDEALKYAKEDLMRNYERYIKIFEEN